MSEPEVHYYCPEELAESVKVLNAIREQLPANHAQYRRHQGSGHPKEIEALTDMQASVKGSGRNFQDCFNTYANTATLNC